MEQHILRLPNVKAITGLSRSTIYLRMSEGAFPRQVNLGSRAVGWLSSEIQQWVDERISSSRLENE
ncbi:MAG TPA: AlpA family transcriptional regulator [SAR324 cluster bacterium]|nr:AlpA family transcriptional regulator [SAR324 cluster bacterium]